MTHITLLVVDIETLGMAPPSALIELGWTSVSCDVSAPGEGRDMPCTHGELQGTQLFGMDGQTMPPDNRAVHHIDPAILADEPLFRMDEWSSFHDADYAVAHNEEFESQWLDFGVPWLCTYKIALRLWPDALSHSNQALKYLLGIPDRPEHHPPHRALPDALVTAQILERILCVASTRMPGDFMEQLVQWSQEPRLLPRCPIGKFRGHLWADVEHGFLQWMLRQPDMEADLRWNAERELTRRRRDG